MMTKLKIGLAIGGVALLIYFAWPAIMWGMKMYVYRLVLDYGFYALLLLAGGGWLWWKLR